MLELMVIKIVNIIHQKISGIYKGNGKENEFKYGYYRGCYTTIIVESTITNFTNHIYH